jgi:predicted nucleic acid-binding protein
VGVSGALLDSNSIIYLVGNRVVGRLPDGPYYASVISEIEVLGFPLLSSADEANLRKFLDAVEIVGLAPEVKDLAIQLKRLHRVKTPDAIIAATALHMGIEVISNDTGMDRVPQLRRIPLDLHPPV